MSNTAPNIEQLSPLQRSVLVIKEMKEKLEQIENKQTEPIAIVGMGCRFPGGANSPKSFWKLLRDGVDGITEVPPQRWDINAYYDPNPETANKMHSKYGGFLDEVDKFDAEFFGLTPREATSLDPQQRLLLEVSWETLENAGIAANKLNGSKTGVFVGISLNEYAQQAVLGTADIDVYTATGNALSVAAGRLSYFLGLQGPALAVDTACSSSLVAVHLACQSLRTGECRQALAGGVYLMLSPQTTIAMSKLRALSADGRCKTFDVAADGYGRGEGCGIVALKRISDAIADGDRILALIRGSAVNQDGRSSGLTVPNAQAQQAVIREALVNAKVEPTQISYVEAHGTGTSLGDPIEVKSLGKVLGKNRSPEQPLTIGSVKTNIGHLEAAAGIASLIKVVLAMQHGEIPPHLHLNELNSHISLEDMVAKIPTKPTAWSVDGQHRLAGISSFGFSGTNAHMVLEDSKFISAEDVISGGDVIYNVSTFILTLSAKTENALEEIKQNYLRFLDEYPKVSLADICFTANTGRKHFDYRLALVVDSVESLRQKLKATNISESKPKAKVVFVFAGEGCQYLGIGRQLYDSQLIFREALDRCNELLEPYLEKSLSEILYDDKSLVSYSKISHLILFSLEYAVFKLWLSWGIEPVAVMGEGVGEYVAACIAGVFSLSDGLKLIIQREQLTQQQNSKNQIVTTKIEYFQPNINLISNITGKFIETETVTQADYWYNRVREKIKFETSCSFLKEQGCELFIEMNNHPTLREKAQQYLSAENSDNWLPSLQENQEDWRVLLQTLATLYEKGVEVDWDGFYQNNSYNRLQLPTYPFERQRYWIDAAKYQPRKTANQQSHPLLGDKLSSPLSHIQFESLLNIDSLPLVKDHCLGGIPVMNLVVYLEMAFAGAATVFDNKNFILTDVIVPTALTFPDSETRTVQLILNSEDSQTASFQIFSQSEGKIKHDWTLNAGGKLNLTSTEILQSSLEKVCLTDIQGRCNQEIKSAEFYEMMAVRGATLGSECQLLEQIWRRDGEALGKVICSSNKEGKESLYHLPLGEIDSCLQIISATCSVESNYSYLIVGFERFRFYGNSKEQLWCHAQLHGNNFIGDAQTIIGDVCLFDATGLVLATFNNVKLKRVSYENLQFTSTTNGRLQHQPLLLSREKLIDTPVQKRQQILENYLLKCLSKSLQLPPEKIKVQQLLSNSLDSLMSFELKSRIETDLQVQVPIEKFFGDTNITQLAEFLLEQFTLANLISEPSPAHQSEDMEEITL